MTFHLYTGNKLDILVKKYIEISSRLKLDPFIPETIIVQSQGMAAWLKQQIADQAGTAANLDFPFINKVVNDVLSMQELNNSFSPEAFKPEVMTLKILKLLFNLPPELGYLNQYINLGFNLDLKKYQLAGKLAYLFDQYQIYRPELMCKWETEPYTGQEEHAWQKYIWQYLTRDNISRSTRLINYLNSPTANLPASLKSLAVFGINTIAPVYLEFFYRLGQDIDVNFFYVNPCRDYWVDQLPERAKERYNLDEFDQFNETFCEKSNLILANLGRQGREFFSTVMNSQAVDFEQDLFDEYLTTSYDKSPMLNIVQQDALDMYNRENRLTLNEGDQSIQLHNCHGKMREIEILYDNLLHIIEDKQIEPRDIIVMAPNIIDYAPYINAKFSEGDIPYNISDQDMISESKVVSAFLELLTLVQSEFKATDVLDLLEVDPVHEAFGIASEDFELINKWLSEVGVCWGIDAEHREDLNKYKFEEFSWRYGLKRMLLGMAMINVDDTVIDNTLPYDKIEGSNAEILGKLVEYVETLFQLGEDFKHPRTIAKWSEDLLNVLDNFFISDNESYRDISFIRNEIINLGTIAEHADFTEEVTIDIIKDHLNEASSNTTNSQAFLRARTTFCTMQPMRNIPAKIICLIGMNDGDFPRQDTTLGFNIIAKEMKPCDRSRRYEDRYLFLEAIMSAREILYISYQGQSIKDNSPMPPASPVCDLLDYLHQSYGDIRETIETKHRLQAFNTEYFSEESRLFSYSEKNFEAAKTLLQPPPVENFLKDDMAIDMEDPEELELTELEAFLSNPCAYYVKHSLGATISHYETAQVSDSEPFELDNLESYKLENIILDHLLKDKNRDEVFHYLKYNQLLEAGTPGIVEFEKRYTDVHEYMVGNNLPSLLESTCDVEIKVKIQGVTITGKLQLNPETGEQPYYRYANIKGKDVVKTWLRHLMANTRQTVTTTMFTKDNKKDHIFNSLDRGQALQELGILIDLFKQNRKHPLPFFCNSAYKYSLKKKSKKSSLSLEQEKIAEAQKAFTSDNYSVGDDNDAAIKLCYPDGREVIAEERFGELARAIFGPVYEGDEA